MGDWERIFGMHRSAESVIDDIDRLNHQSERGVAGKEDAEGAEVAAPPSLDNFGDVIPPSFGKRTPVSRRAPRSSGASRRSDYAPSQSWILIGKEVDGEFIHLPIGVAVHNLYTTNGSVSFGKKFYNFWRENNLVVRLKNLAEQLPPGGEMALDLKAQICRWKSNLSCHVFVGYEDESYAYSYPDIGGFVNISGVDIPAERQAYTNHGDTAQINSAAHIALREEVHATADELAPGEARLLGLEVRLRRFETGTIFRTKPIGLLGRPMEWILGEIGEDDLAMQRGAHQGTGNPLSNSAHASDREAFVKALGGREFQGVRTFSSYQEALAWAKANPGCAITRIPGRDGFMVVAGQIQSKRV